MATIPNTLYEKVLAVVGMLRNSINQRISKIEVAPLFSVSVAYPVDSLVVHDNVLYKCINAHQGEWNSDDFSVATIQDVLEIKAGKFDIAQEYSTDGSYSKYQLVVKNGKFVQCIIPGVGESAVFQEVTIADVLSRLEQEISQCVALDVIYDAVQNIAPAYAMWTDYKVGALCTYKGVFYECVEDVTGEEEDPGASWWNRYWKRTTVDTVLKSHYVSKDNEGNSTLNSLTVKAGNESIKITPTEIIIGSNSPRINLGVSKSGTVALLQDLASDYAELTPGGSEVTFRVGQVAVYENKLYTCTESHTSDVWVASKWTECTIDAVIDALIENIAEALKIGLSNKMTNRPFVTSCVINDDYIDKSSARIFFTPSGLGINTLRGVRIRNCSSNIGVHNTCLYMHVCEMDGDADSLGESADGTILSVSDLCASPVGIWPAVGVDADYIGELDENLVFANPDKIHFLAFDTEKHTVGNKFGTGGSVVGFKVLEVLRSEASGCFAYLENNGEYERYCPLFSFSWESETSRIPMTCCLEEINPSANSSVVDITLPSVASLPDVVEIRIVVAVGDNGPLVLSVNDDHDIIQSHPDVMTTWMNLIHKHNNIFIFRSLGRRLEANRDGVIVLKRLWCVDSYTKRLSDGYNIWTESVSSDWGIASNWSEGVVPNAATNIRFYGGTYAVVLNGSVTVSDVQLDGIVTITSIPYEFRCNTIEGSGLLRLAGVMLKFLNTTESDVDIQFINSTYRFGFAGGRGTSTLPIELGGEITFGQDDQAFSGTLTGHVWDTTFTLSGVATFYCDVYFLMQSGGRLAFNDIVVGGVVSLACSDNSRVTISGTITVNQGAQITLSKSILGGYTLGPNTEIGTETEDTVTLVYSGENVVNHTALLMTAGYNDQTSSEASADVGSGSNPSDEPGVDAETSN